MPTDATIHHIGAQAAVHALVAATTAAGHAPSIHNSQPWRWRLSDNTLDLHLDPSRIRDSTDRDGRLATLSCGAALHHARISLAAQGWPTAVTRMPDQTEPDHLARLRIGTRSTADRAPAPHVAAIPLRWTDRGPVTGAPIRSDQLTAITTAIRAEDTWLHVLYPDEVLTLAAAAERVPRADGEDPGWLAELAYWNGLNPVTTLRSVDHGDLPSYAVQDTGATFAVLHGPADEPEDWLRTGEALSAAWLTAVETGVSVLPMSAPIEVAGTRQAIQLMIGAAGYPHLLLRLGAVDPGSETARPPRAPAEQTIQRG